MRSITLLIDEKDFFDYSFKGDSILFDELKKLLTRRIIQQAMIKCHQTAKKAGFANLSMEDINAEINAIRKNVKNRN